MAATTHDEPGDPTDRELRELVLAEEHRRRVDERRRRHELRRQAEQTATLIGVLDALATTGAEVAVRTACASHPASAIAEVGGDYVALHAADGVRMVPAHAIVAARAGDAVGVRLPGPAITLDLSERLAELASLRQRVHVDAGGRTVVSGQLRQAGGEVLVVRADDGRDTVVALRAVTAVVVGGSPQSSASPPLSAEPTTSG